MFIDFPATISQRVALGSLTSSLRNDALNDKHVQSIAKPVADVKRILAFSLTNKTKHVILSSGQFLVETPLLC